MFCPTCGKSNIKLQNPSPNGGELYVAEDIDSSTEFYDEARPYRCQDCMTQFYLGAE